MSHIIQKTKTQLSCVVIVVMAPMFLLHGQYNPSILLLQNLKLLAFLCYYAGNDTLTEMHSLALVRIDHIYLSRTEETNMTMDDRVFSLLSCQTRNL